MSAIDEVPGCRTLTLEGLDAQNADECRQLLEPFERIERLGRGPAGGHSRGGYVVNGDPCAGETLTGCPSAGGTAFFGGTPTVLRAPCRWVTGQRHWRREWREVAIAAGSWSALRTAAGAQLTVMPHQLEPALAIVAGHASRVLLADAVGLGKTVQAGLIAAELRARGAITSTLVLTPAGLRDQWRRELAERFAIKADVCDLRGISQRAAELPIGLNPWMLPATAIASLDFVKRAEIFPAVRARLWELVIVDEAHQVAPGSDRHAAVSQLCALALHVVLLTATPHNGDREAYAALCALGERDDHCLLFHRTRADVRLAGRRRPHELAVHPSAADTRMHAALDRYVAAVRAEHGDNAASGLLLALLRKRALSSPVSLAQSVSRRLAALGRAPGAGDDQQLWLPLDDGHGELATEDEAPDVDAPALRDVRRERQLLERIALLAAAAAVRETKLAALQRLLRRLAMRGEAVLVFTEYRDTLLHLQRTAAPGALLLHGGLARQARNDVIEAFNQGSAPVLLATDAAGEGLNLHHRCRCVVHLEVPWNPVRLEQRTGRVDRIGQRRTVHAFHLVLKHPAEDRLLQRMRQRAAVAHDDVAVRPPVTVVHGAAGGSGDVGLAADGLHAPVELATGFQSADLASIEAARLDRVRLLLERPGRRRGGPGWRGRGRGQRGGDVPLGVRARARRGLRLHLRGRVLLLIERVIRDAAHRHVASRVDGWWLAGESRATGAMSRLAPAMSADLHEWCVRTIEARERFWSVTRGRAMRVAAAIQPTPDAPFQPGLFDRRGDRAHQARLDEQHLLAAAAHERLRRLEATGGPATIEDGRWLRLEP